MKTIANSIAVVTMLVVACATPADAGPRRGAAPNSSFQVRLGYHMPSGGGEVWEENEAVFTTSIEDFNDFVWGFSFTNGLANNVELGINADFYDATATAGYRDYLDGFGYPILHDTRLRKVPLTVDLRFLPTGRNRANGRSGPVLYLGVGGGANFWSYEETGEFIDFATVDLEIFPGSFGDEGVAWELHALGGLELPLNRGFNLLLEGRYSWSRAELGGELAGLGELDLGGASIFVGGAFRF
jgi:hypothetical protein